MLRHIFGVAIIIAGLIGQYFFGHYKGDLIPYQWLWEVISYIVIGLGVLLMVSSVSRNANKEAKKYWKEIDTLKANADVIKVNFSDCKILNNDHIEDVERNNSGLAATDILAYNLFHNDTVEQVEVTRSVVVYEHSFNGKTIRYNSFVIPKDRVSLLLHLEVQRSTTLYVDKKDRSKYYFDMEFLYKQ